MHLYNIKLADEAKKNMARAEFTTVDNKKISKINWVSDFIIARILMPDGKWISGLAERSIEKLKIGAVIQFERFGFCRFDGKIENEKSGEIYEFWFGHK